MKVIKCGAKVDLKWYAECSNCGSVLQSDSKELGAAIKAGDYRSDGENWAWAECPICQKSVCFHDENSNISKKILLDNGLS